LHGDKWFTVGVLFGEHLYKNIIEDLVIDLLRDREAVSCLEQARSIARNNGMLFYLPKYYGNNYCITDMPQIVKVIAERMKPGNTKHPSICTRP
jgi:hypothetical protein